MLLTDHLITFSPMSFARIKETFLRLPRVTQLIAVGSLVLGISTFLPWYADLDSYRIGDQFLGITGPASFVGIAILFLSGLSLWLSSVRLLERRTPKLPVGESIVHLFVGAQSLFLLLIVNSIYFHQKFGVNITFKESRFGMTLAVVGALVLFVGAYSQHKNQGKAEDDLGHIEPLINIDRPQGRLIAEEKMPTTPAHQRPLMSTEPKRQLRGFGHEKMTAEKPVEKEKKSDSGSYMIRMDL